MTGLGSAGSGRQQPSTQPAQRRSQPTLQLERPVLPPRCRRSRGQPTSTRPTRRHAPLFFIWSTIQSLPLDTRSLVRYQSPRFSAPCAKQSTGRSERGLPGAKKGERGGQSRRRRDGGERHPSPRLQRPAAKAGQPLGPHWRGLAGGTSASAVASNFGCHAAGLRLRSSSGAAISSYAAMGARAPAMLAPATMRCQLSAALPIVRRAALLHASAVAGNRTSCCCCHMLPWDRSSWTMLDDLVRSRDAPRAAHRPPAACPLPRLPAGAPNAALATRRRLAAAPAAAARTLMKGSCLP